MKTKPKKQKIMRARTTVFTTIYHHSFESKKENPTECTREPKNIATKKIVKKRDNKRKM